MSVRAARSAVANVQKPSNSSISTRSVELGDNNRGKSGARSKYIGGIGGGGGGGSGGGGGGGVSREDAARRLAVLTHVRGEYAFQLRRAVETTLK
jgi:hypothetical protein